MACRHRAADATARLRTETSLLYFPSFFKVHMHGAPLLMVVSTMIMERRRLGST